MTRSRRLKKAPISSSRLRLRLDVMEQRSMPAMTPLDALSPVWDAEPNDVLSQAFDIGEMSNLPKSGLGVIGDGINDSSDVDWFSFKLANPSTVNLSVINPATYDAFAGIITLYDNDPFSFSDPDSAAKSRLLARSDPLGGRLENFSRILPAGTYYFALSSAGNSDFHPFLADSGLAGPGGEYQVEITAATLELPVATGPLVIASDPAPTSLLSASPLVLRVSLNKSLDPSTVLADTSVTLFQNSDGDFVSDAGSQVPISWANFSEQAGELQIAPGAALSPGFYHLVLHGDGSAGQPVLADIDGVPLGADLEHPAGREVEIDFQVTGVEGGTVPDDSPATSRDLGNLTDAGSARAEGVIGDDPSFNPNDPVSPASPGADTDLYHFQVSGPGLYALTAEVFAGRIGSRLDPGISLFKLDPADGQLRLVTANEDTRNGVTTENGMVPLYTDPALFAGLAEGDYYLAVSARDNTPDPLLGLAPGVDGVFDPNITHSGLNGSSVGKYVLSATLRAAGDPPRVVMTTIDEGSNLDSSPTGFDIQFTQAVNLQRLAFESFSQPVPGEVRAVTVIGSDGAVIYPRLVGFDSDTNTASFLMLDRLPNDAYELRLSGTQGLSDFADQPLTGNDPGGDYVIHFGVNSPVLESNPLQRMSLEPTDSTSPQDFGVLFPHELQTGIEVVRSATNGATQGADQADFYRFEVFQAKTYAFTLDREGLGLELFDEAGEIVPGTIRDTGDSLQADLLPGIYSIRVNGWTEADAPTVAYRLKLALGTSADNPPPLTIGPRPASVTNLATIPYRISAIAPDNPPPIIPQAPSGSDSSLSDGSGSSTSGLDKSTTVMLVRKTADAAETALAISPPVLANAPLNGAGTDAGALVKNSAAREMIDTGPVNQVSDRSITSSCTDTQCLNDETVKSDNAAIGTTPMSVVSEPPPAPSEELVFPANILRQLRAEPVGGVRAQEPKMQLAMTSGLTPPKSVTSTVEEATASDDSSAVTSVSSDDPDGWIKNGCAVLMMLVVGSTVFSRQMLRRSFRTGLISDSIRQSVSALIGR